MLTSIFEDRKQSLNDHVLVNCAAAVGFLSAYSSDPSQMATLFHAYDGAAADYRVTLGLKIGVLLNGSDKLPGVATLHEEATQHIATLL